MISPAQFISTSTAKNKQVYIYIYVRIYMSMSVCIIRDLFTWSKISSEGQEKLRIGRYLLNCELLEKVKEVFSFLQMLKLLIEIH